MLKKLLSLLSDVAVYGAGNAIGQVINLLLLPLYTRYLAPRDQGVILMLSIISMGFVPVANLGMTNAIFRRFKLEKDAYMRKSVISTGLASVTLSSGLFYVLVWLSAGWLAEYVVGDPGTVAVVRLTGLSAALAAISAVPASALRADRRVKTMVLINLGRLVVSIVATIWLVVALRRAVWGVVVGNLIADIVFTVLQLVISRRLFAALPSLAVWRKMAAYGFPFVPHGIQAITLLVFGQFWVKERIGLDEAGLLGIVSKLAMPVTFVVNAVQSAWTAFKFDVYAEDENPAAFFAEIVTYYAAAMSYLWIGVALWGPEVLRLLTTPAYHGAATLIAAAALVPLTQGLYFMVGTGLELTDNTRVYPLVTAIGLVTVVANSLWLVPQFGANGAALASILGFGVMGAVISRLARQHLNIRYDWPRLGLLALLAAVTGAVAYGDQMLAVQIRFGLAIALSVLYPLVALLILWTSPVDRRRLQSLAARFSKGKRRGPAAPASTGDPTSTASALGAAE